MANIVVYARYSSDKQTEQSIEGQLRVCRDFAERNGHCIIKEYIDRATTGRNTKRPGFIQMIQDAAKKQFSHILCYKLDRFSRNQYDSVIFKKELEKYGVTVISATEAISNTSEGRLVEGLLEIMAEMYSIDLSQKVKRGMRESFLKGNSTGGSVLLGYKIVDKKIMVDEERATIVKDVFYMYANGKTRKEIVAILNKKGLQTAKHKPFTCAGIQHMLKNEKYIGINKYDGEINQNIQYPVLIDKKIFEEVQERLKQNKIHGSNKSKVDFLLSGKIFCGHCGEHMIGSSGKSKTNKTHYYYVCSGRTKKKTCKKHNEVKSELEDAVIEKIHKEVLEKDKIAKLSQWLFENLQKTCSASKINEFEVQIKKIEKELDNCFNLLLKAKNDALIERLNKEADSLTLQKADLENECKKMRLLDKGLSSAAEIEEYLTLFSLSDFNDEQHRKHLIKLFVNSVWVLDKKILIVFNLPTDIQDITFDQITTVADSKMGCNLLGFEQITSWVTKITRFCVIFLYPPWLGFASQNNSFGVQPGTIPGRRFAPRTSPPHSGLLYAPWVDHHKV